MINLKCCLNLFIFSFYCHLTEAGRVKRKAIYLQVTTVGLGCKRCFCWRQSRPEDKVDRSCWYQGNLKKNTAAIKRQKKNRYYNKKNGTHFGWNRTKWRSEEVRAEISRRATTRKGWIWSIFSYKDVIYSLQGQLQLTIWVCLVLGEVQVPGRHQEGKYSARRSFPGEIHLHLSLT